MKPYSLPRRDSLIGFIPVRNKTRKPSRVGRIVDQARLTIRRIAVWSEGVHWATVADFVFVCGFLFTMWLLYWAAYILGWLE